MPLMRQKWIKREDLQSNPNVLYVFGDNMVRKGYGGQAAEMRGEPNGIGVVTKTAPHMGDDAFFGEEPHQIEVQNRTIDSDMKPLFEHVKAGGIVVWPTDDIGTERAELARRSPSTWAHLKAKFAALLKAAEMYEKVPTR